MATSLSGVPALGAIDMLLAPGFQQGSVGDVIEVQLRVRADGAVAEPFDSLDAIIHWDPAVLRLLGTTQAGAGATFFLTGFLPDPAGLNDDLEDGSAVFTALGTPGATIPAPPADTAGLLVTTFRFEALAAVPATEASFIPEVGPFVSTRVLLAGGEVTGTIDAVASVALCPECVGDLDGSGSVDGADLGLLLAAWGGGGCADLDGSGSVDGADLGLLLAAWGPCP